MLQFQLVVAIEMISVSNSREIGIRKIVVVGLALVVVLVTGFVISAQAECAFGCLAHINLPSCSTCRQAQDKDYDRPDATCEGAYRYGTTTPEPMGSIGY